MYRRNAWEKYREEDLRKVMDFNEGYKRFLSSAKTERECVKEAVRLAEEKGFVNLQGVFKSGRPLKAGDKLYGINRHKNVVLFVLGEKPL
ncbi:aminopeptidase, partial [Pseudomonas aeruginosa]|nr:aminopeptidase [Pseudomonas aeruginosa]